jgi:hypothetical protein
MLWGGHKTLIGILSPRDPSPATVVEESKPGLIADYNFRHPADWAVEGIAAEIDSCLVLCCRQHRAASWRRISEMDASTHRIDGLAEDMDTELRLYCHYEFCTAREGGFQRLVSNRGNKRRKHFGRTITGSRDLDRAMVIEESANGSNCFW